MSCINLSLINSNGIENILMLFTVLNSCWQMSDSTAVIMNISLLYHFHLIHFFFFLMKSHSFIDSLGMFKSEIYSVTQHNQPAFLD